MGYRSHFGVDKGNNDSLEKDLIFGGEFCYI